MDKIVSGKKPAWTGFQKRDLGTNLQRAIETELTLTDYNNHKAYRWNPINFNIFVYDLSDEEFIEFVKVYRDPRFDQEFVLRRGREIMAERQRRARPGPAKMDY